MKSLVIFLFSLVSAVAQARFAQEGYIVKDISRLKEISSRPELTVDHVRRTGFEVYGPLGLGRWLTRAGFQFQAMPMFNTMSRSGGYPAPEDIEKDLQSIATAYPQITKLFSIGKSTRGRQLWVMKISRNAAQDDGRPEFKYIANMHGDEIVGREMMMRLIRELVTNDGKNQRITQLLDSTQIYIMPSMNPDGAAAGTRSNAAGVDLNRDFPDFSTNDNQNTPEGRAVETQAVMRWEATRKFVLSANFHGGAEVVNYPFDTIPDPHPKEQLVKALSLNYAKLAPYIGASTSFENGITNGYAWYEVNGGMQDWSDHWHHDLQLTIELSDMKWPSYSTIDQYYAQNRIAMLDFIEKVHTSRLFLR